MEEGRKIEGRPDPPGPGQRLRLNCVRSGAPGAAGAGRAIAAGALPGPGAFRSFASRTAAGRAPLCLPHLPRPHGAAPMADTEQRIRAIIVEKLGVDEADITREASFTNDLGADSLDTVELIMEFEKEFDLTIPDEDAEKIGTVGDAVDYVESKKTA